MARLPFREWFVAEAALVYASASFPCYGTLRLLPYKDFADDLIL